MVKVFRKISKDFKPDIDYEVTDSNGTAEMRNYYMSVNTLWEGDTYLYQSYIDITYEKASTPELTAGKLTIDKACFAAGDTVNIEYSFRNIGPDTNKPFKVDIRVDGVLYKTDEWDGAPSQIGLGRTFSYTFSSAVEKTVTVKLDAYNNLEEPSEADNLIKEVYQPKSACGGDTGSPEVVQADFAIEKPVIDFGQPNSFQPNVSVTGGNSCAIKTAVWKAAQGQLTQTWATHGGVYAQSFAGPPYPGGMSGGTVNVTLNIVTTCGTEQTVGPKPFQIAIPAGNNPPVYEAAWFQGGNTYGYPPVTEVVVGEMVDLGIVHDPTKTPQTPYDPDGDGIVYTWDFAGSDSEWVRSIPVKHPNFWKHDEHFRLIKADMLGTHKVKVRAIDTRGASGGMRDVTLHVVPENPPPIPIITLPPRVVEGRHFTPDISGEGSYSPRKGRTIASYEWTGKQTMYPAAGTYPITLAVTDSAGIRSVEPASANLNVLPDLEPIPALQNPGKGIRGTVAGFKDISYSPDGDPIEVHSVTMSYDSNNDGSFAGETSWPVTLDAGGVFEFKPTKVGRYSIHIFVREGLGYKRSAAKDFQFEVVNEAPEASFYTLGSDYSPPDVQSSIFAASDIVKSSTWKVLDDSGQQRKNYTLNREEGALQSPGFPGSTPFTSLTGNITGVKHKKWSCDWVDDRCDGLSRFITLDLFNTRNGTFVNTNLDMDKNPPAAPIIDRMKNGHGRDYLIKGVDVENDRIWMYSDNYSTSLYGDIVAYDEVFRISDLTRDALEGRNSWPGAIFPPQPTQKAVPIYDRRTIIKNDGRPFTVPPLPAVVWPGTPDKQSLNRLATGRLPVHISYWNSEQGRTETTKLNSYFDSPFTRDYADNTYKYACVYEAPCHLQKLNPSGEIVWESLVQDKTIPAWDQFNRNGLPITYISRDNSKLVLAQNRVYDNNTGALLATLPANFGHNFTVADERIVYFTYTVEASTWPEQKTIKIYAHIYDLRTGATVDVQGPVSTYNRNEDSSSSYEPRGLATKVSADNRVAVYVGSSLNVFDVQGNRLVSNYKLDWSEYTDLHYIGDGKLIVAATTISDKYAYTNVSIISSAPDPAAKRYSFGQLYSDNATLGDGEASMQLKFNYDNFSANASAGLGLRMKDAGNMYRMEVTPNQTRLIKIVNGVRTVLQEADYALTYRQYYAVKVKVNGTRIRAYIGGVPILDVTDGTFIGGYIGPYMEAEHVLMKDLALTKYRPVDNKLQNVAIVGSPLEYVRQYSDLEKDPAIDALTRWTYTQTEPNKFLDAGDGYSGLSAHSGKTVTSPQAVLDKVGLYRIDYQLPDDPAPTGYVYPSKTFEAYRKYSDVSSQSVIVHRRPIARFTLSLNGDGTVTWHDSSYDPDRWLNAWTYSTEATGIDYRATRGVAAFKRNYTTPSGVTLTGQFVRPQESGLYTVREAVKDEYGAWSDWQEQTIFIAAPAVNHPPSVVQMFPTGSLSNPDFTATLTPTVMWTQADPDPGTVFNEAQISVRDESGNTILDRVIQQNTTSASGAWQLDTALELGRKYQVQVRISDDTGTWSPWSGIGWLITNRPPSATMSDPGGESADAPTKISVLRPAFKWNQTDPDPGTVFTYFQLQVMDRDGTVIYDSGQSYQGSANPFQTFIPHAELPVNRTLQVRVRVFDGIVWSPYSASTWFFINRPPSGNITFAQPIYEHDTPTFTVQMTDPDRTPLNVKVDARFNNGAYATIMSWNGAVSGATKQFTYGPLSVGVYTLRLTVNDGVGGIYTQSYTFTVLPLQITGQVTHTPEWEAYRQSWNERFPWRGRAPDVFWAGEALVLSAQVTGTGPTGTRPLSVQATLVQTYDIEGMSSPDQMNYSGEMLHQTFARALTDGVYTMRFTVLWSNGLMKSYDVSFVIAGNMYDVLVNQIRH